MKIEIQNPPDATKSRVPRRYGPHGRYDALFAAIADGKWASVTVHEVTGVDAQHKQTNLHCLAKIRRMKIQTTVQQGRVYVRRIDVEQPEELYEASCIHCKEEWEQAQQRDQEADRA